MEYIIKNNKYNNYFNRLIGNQYHFVERIEEAHIFKNKKEANKVYKKFKHKDMFNIEIFKKVHDRIKKD